jgi:hypothetical protein
MVGYIGKVAVTCVGAAIALLVNHPGESIYGGAVAVQLQISALHRPYNTGRGVPGPVW